MNENLFGISPVKNDFEMILQKNMSEPTEFDKNEQEVAAGLKCIAFLRAA